MDKEILDAVTSAITKRDVKRKGRVTNPTGKGLVPNNSELARKQHATRAANRRKRKLVREVFSDILYDRRKESDLTNVEEYAAALVAEMVKHPKISDMKILLEVLGELLPSPQHIDVDVNADVAVKPELFDLPDGS